MAEISSIIQESLDGNIFLPIEVQPNASRDSIIGMNEWRGRLQVAVKAQPQKGAANKAVIRLLSEILEIPSIDLEITQGHTSRQKMVKLKNILALDVSESMNKILTQE